MTLADKKAVLNHKYGAGVYYERDVKQFIKELKNYINNINYTGKVAYLNILDEIDKLVGEELL